MTGAWTLAAHTVATDAVRFGGAGVTRLGEVTGGRRLPLAPHSAAVPLAEHPAA